MAGIDKPDISKYRDKKIAVLMGGMSSEREISLRSGENIYTGLISAGLHCVKIDVKRDIASVLSNEKPDIAFIALHGTYGEDGCIQGLLEIMEIPYTGSGVLASSIAMNKYLTKKIAIASGIPVPAYIKLDKNNISSTKDKIKSRLGFPVILKPVEEGSSIGVELIHTEAELDGMIDNYITKFPASFAEQYIKGKEITIGVLGKGKNLTEFPILELCPKNEFYDYEAKYTKGLTEMIIPAKISKAVAQEAQTLAKKGFIVFGLSGIARLDFMIDDSDKLYLIEANTNPGFTSTSDIPEMATAKGMSIEELLVKTLDCVEL